MENVCSDSEVGNHAKYSLRFNTELQKMIWLMTMDLANLFSLLHGNPLTFASLESSSWLRDLLCVWLQFVQKLEMYKTFVTG